MAKVFIGQIIHTKSLNELEMFTNGFIVVDALGKITAVGSNFSEYTRVQGPNFKIMEEVHLTGDQFIMPGFVDCHVHAPQMANIGLGLDKPLLEWLNTYTFPLEAKFSDQVFAVALYNKVVKITLNCGTTLASYFGTHHKKSTLILAKETLKRGQRALIGKVCSDRNCPNFYIENTDESVTDTEDFINDMKALGTDLVRPTITPRFALSCTEELLIKLGAIARKHNLNIQSHISENIDEINLVKDLFSSSYAKVYDKVGLLGNKTIMAHAVHLEDEEIELLSKRRTAVAHCPASNTMLGSGLCDVKRLLKAGIKVGLGTDVSGGNSPSIKDAILRALDISRALEFVKKQNIKGCGTVSMPDKNFTPLSYKEAIYLATLGGAEALAMDEIVGNFTVGKEFDALLIDTNVDPLHNFDKYKTSNQLNSEAEEKLLELMQKFIYAGDDRNILKVFVAGREIKNIVK